MSLIRKIAPDKWKHFFVGIGMGLCFQAFFNWWMPSRHLTGTLMAFLAVVVISYGFELFSKWTGRGHYEVMDAVAAIIGGLIGMGLVLLC
ncbi:MAG: hypothetical protein ACXVMS_02790 [Flavisolibacter sp.]